LFRVEQLSEEEASSELEAYDKGDLSAYSDFERYQLSKLPLENLKSANTPPPPGALDKADAWAEQVLSVDPRTKTRAGLDPAEEAKRLAAVAVKGAVLIRNGVRSFAEWSRQIIAQIPELANMAESELRDIYAKAQDIAEQLLKQDLGDSFSNAADNHRKISAMVELARVKPGVTISEFARLLGVARNAATDLAYNVARGATLPARLEPDVVAALNDVKLRQMAQRYFTDAQIPDEVKAKLDNILFKSISLEEQAAVGKAVSPPIMDQMLTAAGAPESAKSKLREDFGDYTEIVRRMRQEGKDPFSRLNFERWLFRVEQLSEEEASSELEAYDKGDLSAYSDFERYQLSKLPLENLKSANTPPPPGALDKADAWAEQVLSVDPRTKTRAGLDPAEEAKRLAAVAVKGAVLIRNGVRSFAEWSRQIIAQIPELANMAESELRDIYAKAQDIAEQLLKQDLGDSFSNAADNHRKISAMVELARVKMGTGQTESQFARDLGVARNAATDLAYNVARGATLPARLEPDVVVALNDVKLRQMAQRYFTDAQIPDEVKAKLDNILFTSINLDAEAAAGKLMLADMGADAAQAAVLNENSKLDFKQRKGLQSALEWHWKEQSLSADPAARDKAHEALKDLMVAVMEPGTFASQTMNLFKLLAASPAANIRLFRDRLQAARRRAWDDVKSNARQVLDAHDQAATEATDASVKDKATQTAAGQAVDAAVTAEADKAGSPIAEAIRIDASNSLQMLPSVLKAARDKVTQAWHKVADGKTYAGELAKRGSNSLLNAIESAVTPGANKAATVAGLFADLTASLRDQVNLAMGVKPGQVLNPQTHMQKLRQLFEHSEQLSIVWGRVRAQLMAKMEDATPEQQLAYEKVLAMSPVEVFGQSLLRNIVADHLKSQSQNIVRLVTNHFRGIGVNPDSLGTPIAQRLAQDAGIEPNMAQSLVAAIEQEWKAQVAKERAKLVERIKQSKERIAAQQKRTRQSRSIADREAEAAAKSLAAAAKPSAAKPAVQEFYQRLTSNLRRLFPQQAGQVALTDMQLIREAFTNPEAYADVWQRLGVELRAKYGIEGLAQVETTLGALTPEALVETNISKALRAEISKARLNLSQILRSHQTQQSTEGKTLADRLTAEAGLTGPQADKLANAFQSAWKRELEARRAKLVEKLLLPRRLKRAVESKHLWQKFIELHNMGVFNDTRAFTLLQEQFGLPNVTAEHVARILKLSEAIQRAPEGIGRDNKVHDLLDYITRAKGTTMMDWGWAIYYANLFGRVSSLAINVASNFVKTPFDMAVDIATDPAAFLGWLKQAGYGAREGLRDAGSVIATGRVTGARLNRSESSPLLETVKGKLGAALLPLKLTGRGLAAGDVPFYRLHQEAAWVMYARLIAKKEGLKGEALERRVESMLGEYPARRNEAIAQAQAEGYDATSKNPVDRNEFWRRVDDIIRLRRDAQFPELATWTKDVALERTFNADMRNTLLGNIGTAFNKLRGKPGLRWLTLFQPVVRVVANQGDYWMDWTPGLNWYRAGKYIATGEVRGKETSDPLAGKRLMATVALSHMALLGIAALSFKDDDKDKPGLRFHGRGPKDNAKRRALPQGWIPHSFQIGEKFYPIWMLGPLAMQLDIIGNYQDAARYGELDKTDATTRAAYAFAQLPATILDQNIMQGLTTLDRLRDLRPTDKSMAGAAATVARMVKPFVVPGWVDEMDKLNDPTRYVATDVQAALLMQVPFARGLNGQPDLNMAGQPIQYSPTMRFGSSIEAAPEMVKWLSARNVAVEPSSRALVQYDTSKPMTDAEYYRYVKEADARAWRELPERRKVWLKDGYTPMMIRAETAKIYSASRSEWRARNRYLSTSKTEQIDDYENWRSR
jgi:hypothetical protein